MLTHHSAQAYFQLNLLATGFPNASENVIATST